MTRISTVKPPKPPKAPPGPYQVTRREGLYHLTGPTIVNEPRTHDTQVAGRYRDIAEMLNEAWWAGRRGRVIETGDVT